MNYFLEIGKTYRVSCFAKSDINTNGMFRLWCHDDNTGVKPLVDLTTYFKTPSIEGEKVELIFKAEYTKNIRIHLQYKPGRGTIEISDVRLQKLKI